MRINFYNWNKLQKIVLSIYIVALIVFFFDILIPYPETFPEAGSFNLQYEFKEYAQEIIFVGFVITLIGSILLVLRNKSRWSVASLIVSSTIVVIGTAGIVWSIGHSGADFGNVGGEYNIFTISEEFDVLESCESGRMYQIVSLPESVPESWEFSGDCKFSRWTYLKWGENYSFGLITEEGVSGSLWNSEQSALVTFRILKSPSGSFGALNYEFGNWSRSGCIINETETEATDIPSLKLFSAFTNCKERDISYGLEAISESQVQTNSSLILFNNLLKELINNN